ncbi:MAG: cysteine hydrolase family protein [Candidatus Dormibacteria bacterium]
MTRAVGATALLVVDVQRDMLELETPVPAAAEVRPVLHTLLERARAAGAVVVHIQNDGSQGEPDEIGTPGWELVFLPNAGEILTHKVESDAFAGGSDLGAKLATLGIGRVVVCGMLSDHCVAATSRGARRKGFDVVLASEAHATYDQDQPAAVISAAVEADLRADGVEIQAAADIDFRCVPGPAN